MNRMIVLLAVGAAFPVAFAGYQEANSTHKWTAERVFHFVSWNTPIKDGLDLEAKDFVAEATRLTNDCVLAAEGSTVAEAERAVRLFKSGETAAALALVNRLEAERTLWQLESTVDPGDVYTPTVREATGTASRPTAAAMAALMRAFSYAWQTKDDEGSYRKAKALADSLACQQRRRGYLCTDYRIDHAQDLEITGNLYAAFCLKEFAAAAETRGKTVKPERILIWPAGKTPSAQANQTYAPYIDWYTPAVKKTKLVLIHCSGGGYGGSNDDGFEVNPVRAYFLDRGVTVVTLRYRAPRPISVKKHLTAWQDAQRAIRIVRSEAAKHGVNPEKIGFLGCSAGGHLTLLAALSSSVRIYDRIDAIDDVPCHLNFAVPVYPAYALIPELEKGDVKGCDDLSVGFDPDFAFDAKTPPMCLVHGGIDGWSPMASVRVYHKLHTMNIPCELHVLAMEGHCFMEHPLPGFPASTWKDRVWEWLFRMYLLK